MTEGIFERTSRINAPVEEVFNWHARLGAIERYSPPWDPIAVISRSGGIETGAEVKIRMKAGPVPYLWHARHTDFEVNRLFRDKQVRGPFSKWVHTHEFEPQGKDSCLIRDLIQYKLPPHPFRRSVSYRMVEKKLDRIFAYRHTVLQQDLKAHLARHDQDRLTVLISGSSGLIGSSLIPYLTTGGHRVIKLVRRQPLAENEVFWDPAKGVLDGAALKGIDAVVHLAGENIGKTRWTPAQKDLILSSRIDSTRLLTERLTQMDDPPKVFLSASAIGFYGDRGRADLTEVDEAGVSFISEVCQRWEDQTNPAQDYGIRTAVLRIGVVVDPRGGALSRLLPLFKAGIKTHLSPGDQYISWIGLNDTIDAIVHIINTPGLSGAINLVAPHPVTSGRFYRQLGEQYAGLFGIRIPERLINAAFGQMGKEVLLASTRVNPGKLLASGFRFRYSELNGLFNHVLGKEKQGKS